MDEAIRFQPGDIIVFGPLAAALRTAATCEKQGGKPVYVARTDDRWLITDRMPLMGEWYFSDGIRHG